MIKHNFFKTVLITVKIINSKVLYLTYPCVTIISFAVRDDWSDCYVVVHSDSGPRRSVQIPGTVCATEKIVRYFTTD